MFVWFIKRTNGMCCYATIDGQQKIPCQDFSREAKRHRTWRIWSVNGSNQKAQIPLKIWEKIWRRHGHFEEQIRLDYVQSSVVFKTEKTSIFSVKMMWYKISKPTKPLDGLCLRGKGNMVVSWSNFLIF